MSDATAVMLATVDYYEKRLEEATVIGQYLEEALHGELDTWYHERGDFLSPAERAARPDLIVRMVKADALESLAA